MNTTFSHRDQAYRLVRRGPVYQLHYTREGQRQRVSTGTGDLEQAIRKARDHIDQLLDGARRGWTLLTAVQHIIETRWLHTKNESKARKLADEALDYFGRDVPVTAITADSVGRYITHLRGRENGNATVNRKLAALRVILRCAHRAGHLPALPYIPHMKEQKGRVRWLTEEEEAQVISLLERWSMADLHDLVVYLLDTGWRLGEALRLDVDRDVDWEREVATVWVAKSGRPRTTPLTQRALAALAGRKGWGMSYTQAVYQWSKVRQHLGLHDVVLHTLRHTCCSRLVQRGVPLAVVQQWMGHESIQTTMRYAHLAPVHLEQARAALEPQRLRRVG